MAVPHGNVFPQGLGAVTQRGWRVQQERPSSQQCLQHTVLKSQQPVPREFSLLPSAGLHQKCRDVGSNLGGHMEDKSRKT